MKQEHGFANVLLLSALPVLIGAMILVYTAAGLIQWNTQMQSECRQEQIGTQAQVRDLLVKLLGKNERATYLRQSLNQAYVSLAAAVASFNAPLVQALEARIQYLEYQRRILDIYQKSLLTAARLLLAKSAAKTYAQAQQHSQNIRHLQGFLETQTQVFIPIPPDLAVEPEYPDVAPPYRPENDFSERQALVQKWQYQFRLNRWLEKFVRSDARFDKICSTTIEAKGDEWIVTTKEDKFLSKP